MTDYVGYEKFLDFAKQIVSPAKVYIGKFNQVDQVEKRDRYGRNKDYNETHTICVAAWKASDDVVHYYRCEINQICLTPVEIMQAILKGEGKADEAQLFKQGNTEILYYMKEIIMRTHAASAIIAFIPAVFSLPADLNPPPLQMDEEIFNSSWDSGEFIDDIEDDEDGDGDENENDPASKALLN